MLAREFGETAKWSHANVGPDVVTATRKNISGFRFYSKYRATQSAKTRGQRDSYCSIELNSRAERIAKSAGLSLKKSSDRVLRSRKDIERFWARIISSGLQVHLIK